MFEVAESSIEQESLLKRIAELCRDYEQSKKRDGRTFNVFHLCGVDDRETKHSKILAEFLNPSGSHGMGSVFLAHFLALPKVRAHLLEHFQDFSYDDASDLETAVVRTEEVYEHGRCDITIHWRRWCIVIENKIYAADQPRQLRRYYDDIVQWEIPMIFYLTLDGHEPSPDSADGITYCPISYSRSIKDAKSKGDIVEWIDVCANDIEGIPPSVREPLMQYKNLITELSRNQGEQIMVNNIAEEIVRSKENFLSAGKISCAMQTARAKVIIMVMKNLANVMNGPLADWELVYEQLCEYERDNAGKSKNYLGFELVEKRHDVPRRIKLRGEFQNGFSDLFFGFTRNECDVEFASSFWREANASPELKAKYQFYPKDGKGWVYGAYPDDRELRTWPDESLSSVIMEREKSAIVRKLVAQLTRMLSEAAKIVDKIEKQ